MNGDVFSEAFLVRLLPMYHEVVLGAIRHFRFAEYPPYAVLAACGALLALAVYYAVGCLLRPLPQRVSTPGQQARIEAMRPHARRLLPWLLLLAPTPLGGVVVMAAAFFRLPLRHVLVPVIASEILWRTLLYGWR